MTRKEILDQVREAYYKLDEAKGELEQARRRAEDAEEMVGEAFNMLEAIPTEVDEIDEDEAAETEQPKEA